MIAGNAPRKGGDAQRMQVIDPESGAVFESSVGALPELLQARDVLVINDAATLPSSIRARVHAGTVELRFTGPPDGELWTAVVFGDGDWRTDTDRRPAPPPLEVGARIDLPEGLVGSVIAVDDRAPRLITLAFATTPARVLELVLRHGRPIQYAYVSDAVTLAQVQTAYAARPWAAEMPSAGRPLTWSCLLALRRRGVTIASLTHAAGISATGDAALDARLPLPERYDLPSSTVHAIEQARDRGGRIVAVGTSVVRALEGCVADRGRLVAGEGTTALHIGGDHAHRIVDGVLSGVHEPGTSHHRLLSAFAPAPLLARAHVEAERSGLRIHEFGDSSLVLPGASRARLPVAA